MSAKDFGDGVAKVVVEPALGALNHLIKVGREFAEGVVEGAQGATEDKDELQAAARKVGDVGNAIGVKATEIAGNIKKTFDGAAAKVATAGAFAAAVKDVKITVKDELNQ